jgi:hypothetical protein
MECKVLGWAVILRLWQPHISFQMNNLVGLRIQLYNDYCVQKVLAPEDLKC